MPRVEWFDAFGKVVFLVLLGLWFLVSHWCWCGSLGRCCNRSMALKKSTFTRNSKTAAQTKRLILNYWFIFSITVYKHIFYAYIYLCILMRIRVHRHPVNKTSTSLLLKSWSRLSTRQEQESWNWSKGLNEWFFSWRKLVAIRNQQTEKGRLFLTQAWIFVHPRNRFLQEPFPDLHKFLHFLLYCFVSWWCIPTQWIVLNSWSRWHNA